MVGDDLAGASLVQMIEAQRGAPNEGEIEPRLAPVRDRPTVTKTRYLGGHQQIVRVDREVVGPAPPEIESFLLEEIDQAVAAFDLVVASDYGKGVLTGRVLAALFAACARERKMCIVDPKRLRFADYRGATLITPNRKELSNAVGLPTETDQEAETAANKAIAESGAAILLTRSEKGMSLFRADAAPVHLPAEAQEVFDVSGAGDTVVAGVALGLASGLAFEQSMRIANAAAGVAVAKLGTAVVTQSELAAALKTQGRAPARGASLASLERAVQKREQWRAQGLIVGFTNGCFDLLHPGHVSLIAQAAEACDRLIVALNSDTSVSRLKGPERPVQPLENRAAVINALKGVDLVISFEEETPVNLIEALAPDVLVKGADYAETEVVGADIVKARGGRVILAKLADGQSTTALVQKARKKAQ
jgi:D-beta-D-heptose 7-phosphate kinase/D-beta-D-heptose 1-phosphate adenosyltransferase